jgi:hypothetical protein
MSEILEFTQQVRCYFRIALTLAQNTNFQKV